MNRLAVVFFITTAWSGAVRSQNADLDPNRDRYAIPSYRLHRVTELRVTQASIQGDYDPSENCGYFQMTAAKGKYFFRHAKVISEGAAFHDFLFSSCSSRGTVKFSNGDEGEWSIKHGATGWLQLKSGRFKGRGIHLHCPPCEEQSM